MKTLVLFLLLIIFNNVELKQNILLQMEEEEPDLTLNLDNLRRKASQAVNKLFSFYHDFSKVKLEETVVIHIGNPQITAKLSASCKTSILLGKNSGTIKVKNNKVISQSGTNINLSKNSISSINNNLKIDFKTVTATLTSKLQGSVVDGTVNFSFSILGEANFQIIFNDKNGDCEGSLTITIKPGNTPTISQGSPALNPQPAFNPQAIQQAVGTVATGGAIAVGAILLFKLLKGVAGFCVGGPVGALIGVAT